jgi:SAM-dependent methyltransferase
VTALTEFVLSQLPPAPARVLEVGCGEGELARALDSSGYDVVAIDPEAPEGPIFRRTTVDEFEDADGFDAVVASRSLHHVHELGAALDKLARMLRGPLVLDEFVWDQLDGQTAEQFGISLPDWYDEHEGLHGYAALRRELDARFEERLFEWRPYLYRYDEIELEEDEERRLIESGAIAALGFRYAGVPR